MHELLESLTGTLARIKYITNIHTIINSFRRTQVCVQANDPQSVGASHHVCCIVCTRVLDQVFRQPPFVVPKCGDMIV